MHRGSSARKSPVSANARDRDPPQTFWYSHSPHFPPRCVVSRSVLNSSELRYTSVSDSSSTFPPLTGRNPLGKISPVCDTNTNPLPSLTPAVRHITPLAFSFSVTPCSAFTRCATYRR